MGSSITHTIDGEYIREWLVLGPFFPDDLGKDFLSDTGGEASIEPKEGDTVTTADGKTLTWKRYESGRDIVNLLDAVGDHEYATAYAFCVLQSEIAGEARIYLGSDDGVAVWINGERVHLFYNNRALVLNRDVFSVSLKTGANRCLVKVSNITGDWEFAMRVLPLPPERAVITGIISDESGNPIPKANVRLEQSGEEIAKTTTDVSGSYRLEIYPVRGQYDLSAISENLGIWQLGIELAEGERRTLNLTLKEAVSIEGTLLMLDDATPHVAVPVQALVAQASLPVQVAATTLSDENGKYQFINLKPGQYQLRCQVLGGYVYYEEEKAGRPEDQKAGKQERRTMPGELISLSAHKPISLRVEQGETLKNINFRFAPFKKGTWRKYGYQDGLTREWIPSIYCDPDDVMWFGSETGVFRYDGKDFIHFTKKDGLAYGHPWSITRDLNGMMWFGMWNGGVSRYDGKRFKNFTTKDGLAGNTVFAIHCDPDGILWFGTIDGGISRYDGKEFVNITTKDGLVSNSVYAIHRDPDGVMWFGTQNGVSRYDGKEFVNITTKDGLVHNFVVDIHRDPDGMMWFAAWGGWGGKEGGGVSRYDGKEFVNFTTKDGLVDNRVFAIHQDQDGVMWFGTCSGGVSRYDGKTFVNFTSKDGLSRNAILGIQRDPDGGMWFGTDGGGLLCYDPKTFVNFTIEDGLGSNSVRAIHRDPDGVMWFATDNFGTDPILGEKGGVSRYIPPHSPRAKGGIKWGFINLTTKDGLTHNSVVTIHRDPDGVMWFGTSRHPGEAAGVSRYDGKEFTNFTTRDGLAHNNVNAIYRDPDGVMWFGTKGGVSRYDGKEFINLTTKEGLLNNIVNAICRDPDGVLWFGTGDTASAGGLSRYDGRDMGNFPHFVNFTIEDGLAGNAVRYIHRDPDGVMWFATESGVSRYDGKGFINLTIEDGLADDYVNTIYRGLDGILWFGTDNGVSMYDGIAWSSLDTRDGLAGRYVVSILQDPDGFLWFGTQDGGVTRYRRSTTPPKARIVSVTTDQTYRDLSAIPAFTPSTRVTIEYNSIDFKTVPEKRQYRCRVIEIPPNPPLPKGGSKGDFTEGETRGIDTDWRKPTKATSYDFVFDESGTYTFQVQAIDRDLNYSEPASVKLEVIPDPRNHRIIQLEEHIRQQELAEMERMQQELENARQIQQSLLPKSPPQIKGFDIAGTYLPAKEVSGDFYDYLPLGKDAGIVLADVTGKSVKAAMVAALADGMLDAQIKGRRDLWGSPSKILREMNLGLRPRLIRNVFVAMSLGIIRAQTAEASFSTPERKLLFSNAGMPYPIVKHGKKVWELEVSGIPLGLTDRAEYQESSFDLEEGDSVVFYSDGIIEAANKAEEMYETERLLRLIQQADPGLSAQRMVDLILRDVTAYVGGEEASDDITIVVIRCKEFNGCALPKTKERRNVL